MTESGGSTYRAPGNSSTSGVTIMKPVILHVIFALISSRSHQHPLWTSLYCWPCLYRWLRIHQSKKCPVCKALTLEEKLIPLCGRGKTPTDPRSKPIPSLEIPHHPAGQRPDTAPSPPEASNFLNVVLGLMCFMPFASATFSSFEVSACLFGGVYSPLFSVQFHRYHHGYPDSHRRVNPETSHVMQVAEENLKRILFVIIFVLIAFLLM